MTVRLYQRDYARSDEKRFFSMNRHYEKLEELTYAELCLQMRKDLEEMIDEGFLSKEQAFDLEGDIPAYNELAESFYN